MRNIMCGRFYIDDGTSLEIKKIVERIQNQLSKPSIKMGEIYPFENVTALVAEKEEIVPEAMTWGVPGFNKGSRIINARSETVYEKKQEFEQMTFDFL